MAFVGVGKHYRFLIIQPTTSCVRESAHNIIMGGLTVLFWHKMGRSKMVPAIARTILQLTHPSY